MAELIPKMPKLTKKQEAFVKALILNGGNQTQAAIDVGYSPNSARNMGSYMLRLPHVREAFQARLHENLAAAKALSVKVWKDIAADGESEHARIAAANAIWDKATQLEGVGKVHGGVHVTLNLNTSDLSATQPIDITPQPIEEQGAITATQSDDESY